jgi:hypothetical protein
MGKWLPYLAIVALIIVNVTLLRQNRDLRIGERRGPGIGEVFPVVSGVDLNEQFVWLDLRSSDTTTLVVFFSSSCRFCLESLPHFLESSRSGLPGTQVVWVSQEPLPETRAFFKAQGVEDLVISEVSHYSYLELGLNTVPQTFVVGPDGIVGALKVGRIGDKEWDVISRCLEGDCG